MYVMVDFICMALVELRGTRHKQELLIEKLLPRVGFDPLIFRSGDISTNVLRYREMFKNVLK